jgi:hypothetical protein
MDFTWPRRLLSPTGGFEGASFEGFEDASTEGFEEFVEDTGDDAVC